MCINHGPSTGISARGQKPSTEKQFINISTACSSHSCNRQPRNGMSLPSLLSHFKKHKSWGCLGFLGVLGVCPTLWLVSAHHHLPQLQVLIASTGWMRAAYVLELTQFPSHLSSEPWINFSFLLLLLSFFLLLFLFLLFSLLSMAPTFSSFGQISLQEQPLF